MIDRVAKNHPRLDLLRPSGTSQTFSGQLSFLRRAYTQDIAGADLVVSGLPFDLATTFRPGARFGPQAIRAASVQLAEIADHAFPLTMILLATSRLQIMAMLTLSLGIPIRQLP